MGESLRTSGRPTKKGALGLSKEHHDDAVFLGHTLIDPELATPTRSTTHHRPRRAAHRDVDVIRLLSVFGMSLRRRMQPSQQQTCDQSAMSLSYVIRHGYGESRRVLNVGMGDRECEDQGRSSDTCRVHKAPIYTRDVAQGLRYQRRKEERSLARILYRHSVFCTRGPPALTLKPRVTLV